jgi:hypothetical protein
MMEDADDDPLSVHSNWYDVRCNRVYSAVDDVKEVKIGQNRVLNTWALRTYVCVHK